MTESLGAEMTAPQEPTMTERRKLSGVLLISVFIVATCGLIYELLAGTIASYLLGDSVTQFSTIIGVYLFSMGVGSYLSRFFHRELLAAFIRVEILVGLVGGLSSPVLYFAFAELDAFRVVLYVWVALTGVLVGLEIPILLRILKDELPFHDLISKVLSLDYLGALIASLLFPLWLVPRVGLMRSSFIFGVLNVAVGVWACHLFRPWLRRWRPLTIGAYLALAVLLAGLVASDALRAIVESRLYNEPVLLARSSPYQRIVLTGRRGKVDLYLDGHLQFSSADEYRYHEALVHPGLAAVDAPRQVLVLGGGDGMAVREILKDERVERVTLVDLDPEMAVIFRDHEGFSALNDQALRSPRVRVVHEDAFVWLETDDQVYDFIVVDFPDPRSYSLGKLYTRTFYRRLATHLAPGGRAAVQSTSPFFARQAFWCIVTTIESAGLSVVPYHAAVPAFGVWGFVLAAHEPGFRPAAAYPAGLRSITPQTVAAMLDFPPDMGPVDVEVNHLDDQVLVRYHEAGWSDAGP